MCDTVRLKDIEVINGDALGELVSDILIKENINAAIKAKIEKLIIQRSEVEYYRDTFDEWRKKLEESLEEWEEQKINYSGNDTLSDVVIENVFEGVCADKIKADLTASVTQMDDTCNKISGLIGNVGLQIDELNNRINIINGEIASLENQLNSI